MLLSQVTTAHLRRVFQVNPDAVWLQDDLDDTAYFPTYDRTFIDLRSTQSICRRTSSEAFSSCFDFVNKYFEQYVGECCCRHTHPQFRSVVSGLGKRASPSANASCRVKVVKAIVNWNSKTNKPSFTPSHQAFIEVQESKAMVDYVTDDIRKWGFRMYQ